MKTLRWVLINANIDTVEEEDYWKIKFISLNKNGDYKQIINNNNLGPPSLISAFILSKVDALLKNNEYVK